MSFIGVNNMPYLVALLGGVIIGQKISQPAENPIIKIATWATIFSIGYKFLKKL